MKISASSPHGMDASVRVYPVMVIYALAWLVFRNSTYHHNRKQTFRGPYKRCTSFQPETQCYLAWWALLMSRDHTSWRLRTRDVFTRLYRPYHIHRMNSSRN